MNAGGFEELVKDRFWLDRLLNNPNRRIAYGERGTFLRKKIRNLVYRWKSWPSHRFVQKVVIPLNLVQTARDRSSCEDSNSNSSLSSRESSRGHHKETDKTFPPAVIGGTMSSRSKNHPALEMKVEDGGTAQCKCLRMSLCLFIL